jgi:hypothetical protein
MKISNSLSRFGKFRHVARSRPLLSSLGRNPTTVKSFLWKIIGENKKFLHFSIDINITKRNQQYSVSSELFVLIAHHYVSQKK